MILLVLTGSVDGDLRSQEHITKMSGIIANIDNGLNLFFWVFLLNVIVIVIITAWKSDMYRLFLLLFSLKSFCNNLRTERIKTCLRGRGLITDMREKGRLIIPCRDHEWSFFCLCYSCVSWLILSSQNSFSLPHLLRTTQNTRTHHTHTLVYMQKSGHTHTHTRDRGKSDSIKRLDISSCKCCHTAWHCIPHVTLRG